MDQNALFSLSYGLFIVTTQDQGQDNGSIINTVMQAAENPCLLSICVNKASLTHDTLQSTGLCTISVMNREADFSLFERFGFQSGREVDKFKDFSSVRRAENGLYYITQGTNAYLSAKVRQSVDLGTHTMFIGEVTEMVKLNDRPSLTYADYFDHIKPKPQTPKTDTHKVIWRCRICGYEYEGETLPSDFICPLCKHPASDFEKIIL